MRRVLLALFVILGLFSLVACGGDDGGSDAEPAATATVGQDVTIESIVVFPVTEENILAPDLRGGSLAEVSLAQAVAVVGSGFSPDPIDNVLILDGVEQRAWLAGEDFAAFIVTAVPTGGRDWTLDGVLDVFTPGGETSTPLRVVREPRLSGTPDETLVALLDVMWNQVVAPEVLDRVATEAPEALEQYEDVAGRLDPFTDEVDALLTSGPPAEIALQAALIENSGFLTFFEDGVPLAVQIAPAKLARVHDQADLITKGAKALGPAATVAGIIIGLWEIGQIIKDADNDPWVSNKLGPIDTEADQGTGTCRADDSGTGESGLNNIYVEVIHGDVTLLEVPQPGSPPGPALRSPFPVSLDPQFPDFIVTRDYVVVPQVTGRNRFARVKCRATDRAANSSSTSHFPLSEGWAEEYIREIVPPVHLIDAPDSAVVGVPFTVTVPIEDKPVGGSTGNPSGVARGVVEALAPVGFVSGEQTYRDPDRPADLTATITGIYVCAAVGTGMLEARSWDANDNTGGKTQHPVTCVAADGSTPDGGGSGTPTPAPTPRPDGGTTTVEFDLGFEHTVPGVQSEVRLEVFTSPGVSVEATLTGPGTAATSSATAGADGVASLSWVITQFGTYSVSGTAGAASFTGSVAVS